MPGHRWRDENQRVEFTTSRRPRGSQADQVRPPLTNPVLLPAEPAVDGPQGAGTQQTHSPESGWACAPAARFGSAVMERAETAGVCVAGATASVEVVQSPMLARTRAPFHAHTASLGEDSGVRFRALIRCQKAIRARAVSVGRSTLGEWSAPSMIVRSAVRRVAMVSCQGIGQA